MAKTKIFSDAQLNELLDEAVSPAEEAKLKQSLRTLQTELAQLKQQHEKAKSDQEKLEASIQKQVNKLWELQLALKKKMESTVVRMNIVQRKLGLPEKPKAKGMPVGDGGFPDYMTDRSYYPIGS